MSNSDVSVSEMLKAIGVSSVWELYSDIPDRYILPEPPSLEGPLSEQELVHHFRRILGRNRMGLKLFLGGGVWPHYVPAVVREIISRSEFLTSYTPYQPEVSQGVLTALFEYQSMAAELYGVDVVNSSMYDWATALGEAILMAHRYNGGSRVLVSRYSSPHRLEVAKTYSEPLGLTLHEVPVNRRGLIDEEALKTMLGKDVTAVYLENPSYLGSIMANVGAVSEIVHDAGALLIVGAEPTSLGLLTPPGDYGADIVVGEGQPLGLPMSFGGPLMGILGCRMDRRLLHVMPGRLVGMTETVRGGVRAFTMILRAREQDIRRHRATSNICTNQALCAIAAAAYLATLGRGGMRSLAQHILSKTAYMIEELTKLDDVEAPLINSPHYMEFTYSVRGVDSSSVLEKLLANGIVGGLRIGGSFPELGDGILTCVTEVHSVEDIREYVGILR
ncbi:MAG: aminomethyl-transferring glycine dehydrogenase subunit GcvPA [Nitrososphaerota archaeon]